MKNLKKVLSLALAFAMVLGLCVGAMAADTTTQDVTKLADWAEVTHKEAAQLLNAFGIMSGDNQGFRPADPVTRAEAAKMIMVTVWGGVDNAELFKDTAIPFTDIKGVTDWATGYIAAAYGYGIISGRNATTFDPKGNVTGYELLKMVLTALGYNAECAGLVGANWDLNAMLLAKAERNETDLTKGADVTNWAAAINRENAAQVIANMVSRHTVKYNKTNDENVVESDKDTFGKAVLKLDTKDAILVANTYGKVAKIGDVTLSAMPAASKDDGENAVVVLLDTNNKVPTTLSYKAVSTTSGLYDLGAYATLYSKDGKVISVAIDTPTVVTPAADGSNIVTTPNEIAIGTMPASPSVGSHAYPTYLDTNADGKIDLITTVNYTTVAPVTDVVTSEKHGTVYVTGTTAKWSSTYEKRANLNNLDGILDDVVFADGTAAVKGDYIAYVTSTNANDDNVKVAVVLDNIDGTIDRVVSGDSANTYYVDGVAHNGAKDATQFGAKGTFYFYPDGYIAGVVGAAPVADHYAVVYKAGYTTTGASTGIGGGAGTVSAQVAAILDNGESGIYNLIECKKGNTTVTVSKLAPATDGTVPELFGTDAPLYNVNKEDGTAVNVLVTYKLSEDGKSISIKIVDTNVLTTQYAATVNSAKFDGTDAKYFTSATVTFISNSAENADEKWGTYVGMPTSSYTVAANDGKAVLSNLYKTEDGLKVLVVEKYTPVTPEVSSSAFVYVLKNNGQIGLDTDGITGIYQLNIYDTTTDTVSDVEVKGTEGANAKSGDFYKSYTASTKDLGDKITISATTYAKGFVTSCGDGVVVLKVPADATTIPENTTVTAYTYDTNTKFYVIDGEDSGVITVADVVTQTPDAYNDKGVWTSGDKYYQAIVEYNNTTKAATVILFAERQTTPDAK